MEATEYDACYVIACVAGGIVDVRNNVLTAQPLKASGEDARRMGRRYFFDAHD